MMERDKKISYAAFLVLSFIWGSTWLFIKFSLEELSALQVAYLRNFIAGLIMLSYFIIRGYPIPSFRQFVTIIYISFFLFVLNTGFGILSVKYMPSYIAALAGCLSPVIIYSIESVKEKKKFNPVAAIGFFIAITGIALALFNKEITSYDAHYFIGVGCAFAAVLSWIYGSFMMNNEKQPLNVYYSFSWQLIISSGILFLISLAKGDSPAPLRDISFKTLLSISYLSLVGSAAAFMIYGYLFKKHLLSKVSLYEYLSPLIATLLGIITLNEPYNVKTIVGIVLTIAGLYLLVRIQKKKTFIRSLNH